MKAIDSKRAPATVRGKPEDLRRRILELTARLADAEETIAAIRSGLVDAVIVDSPEGAQIYTLQGADRTYRVFLEAMGEGALTVTREGLVRYANRRFAEIAGRPLGKIMGESLFSLIAPEERHLLEALLRLGALAGGGRGELFLQPGEGEAVPVSLSISPLPESDPPAFCLVVADFTERKKADAELERYWKHLEDLVNERTAELVEARARVEERVRERTAELAKAYESLQESVIQRVLAFFRPGPLRREPFDVNSCVREALEMAKVSLQRTGAQVAVALREDLPLCLGDRHLLAQALINLLTNAAQAMEGTKGEKRIEVTSALEGGYVVVTVADSGLGVPEELREKIFVDPFFTTKKEGTGIGLSITHRVIADHGGFIRLGTSRFGGVLFTIGIPAGDEGEI
jgi:PAS domain S-box-containing protein